MYAAVINSHVTQQQQQQQGFTWSALITIEVSDLPTMCAILLADDSRHSNL